MGDNLNIVALQVNKVYEHLVLGRELLFWLSHIICIFLSLQLTLSFSLGALGLLGIFDLLINNK